MGENGIQELDRSEIYTMVSRQEVGDPVCFISWRKPGDIQRLEEWNPRRARFHVWRYLAERETRPTDALIPLAPKTIRNLLYSIGQRAGVDDCHPHRFRHTMAIEYLRNGGDIFTLQRILGHSSLEMVQHYLGIVEGDKRQAQRKASPMDNWRL